MLEVGLAVFLGAFLIACAALPKRSKRVPDNVIQFVPRSSPPKATVEAGGQVLQFPITKQETKGEKR